MDDMIEAPLIKRGEMCLMTTFHRGRQGLVVSVKAHPALEDLVRSLGTGETQDIGLWGRSWSALKTPINIYDLSTPALMTVLGNDRGHYRLDHPGQPLIIDTHGDYRIDPVNLSFLRIKGISEGVDFLVKGVYTIEGIRDIADKVVQAERHFYITYMKPVDVTVVVSTQES